MSKQVHILIMAGGTGGHVFPALTVAKNLEAQGVEVTWLGTETGIEHRLVSEAGLPIHYIKVTGLRGKGLLRWLAAPMKLRAALSQAISLLRQIKPDVVLGMGGFASGPGGAAAKLLDIPLVIHEQNAAPGLTNRLLARVAKKVLQAFPHSFSKRCRAETVGNPVRHIISELAEPQARWAFRSGKLRVLVLGGSQGASFLNEIMPKVLRELSNDIDLWHQCGTRNEKAATNAYAGLSLCLEPFIDDMAKAYAWADLVICRSGALTVAELASVGVGSILIPFPHAVDDHQTKNAEFLVQADAAILMQQGDLTAGKLIEQIRLLPREDLLTMAMAARALRDTESCQKIIDTLLGASGALVAKTQQERKLQT